MSNLETKAVIVVLSCSTWSATKADKEITSAVNAEYHSGDGLRVRKQLLAKDRIKPVRVAVDVVKDIHRRHTLPWGDHGERLLPVRQLEAYKGDMARAISNVDAARDALLDEYLQLVKQAERDLNGAFRAADYPTTDDVRAKFGASYLIQPVPSAAHFVADVGAEEAERIKAELQRRESAKLDAAMVSLQESIEGQLRRLIERIGTDADGNPNRIHASALESLQALARAVPRLNLTENRRIDECAARIEEAIGELAIDDLRYRSKRPAAVAAVTKTRADLHGTLDEIASAYFGAGAA